MNRIGVLSVVFVLYVILPLCLWISLSSICTTGYFLSSPRIEPMMHVMCRLDLSVSVPGGLCNCSCPVPIVVSQRTFFLVLEHQAKNWEVLEKNRFNHVVVSR